MRTAKTDQTGRMPRVIWVFAGLTLILLVLSCHGSFLLLVHTMHGTHEPCHEKVCLSLSIQTTKTPDQCRKHGLISVFVDHCLVSFHIQNFKTLASLWRMSRRFEPYWCLQTSEDRFSRDDARVLWNLITMTSLQSISEGSPFLEPGHEKTTCICHMRTTKVQINLRIRAIWSAPSLFAV